MSVILDEKHGVNPSVSCCFICGSDVGVVLWGQLTAKTAQAFTEGGTPTERHGEAPRKVVVDQEPCDKCRGHMELGVMLVEVTGTEDDPRPTGTLVVIKDEAIEKMFEPRVSQDVLDKRMAYVPADAWDALGLPRENKNHEVQLQD